MKCPDCGKPMKQEYFDTMPEVLECECGCTVLKCTCGSTMEQRCADEGGLCVYWCKKCGSFGTTCDDGVSIENPAEEE